MQTTVSTIDAAAARLRRLGAALAQPQLSTAARERRDMLVLLLAVACVVLPHFDHLPWWASVVLVLLWSWRLWLTLAQRPLPGRLAMLPLLVATTAAVWLEHKTLVGRDAGVTFLLLLMALKILEMRARRDVFVVIFLSFFILLTQFMFGQGLPVAALTLATVVLLFFALTSVNLADTDLPAGTKLKLVGIVLAKSIPLTIVLFVLFPRLSGPLWSLPGDNPAGRTGLSNSMSPGSIGRLFGSDEIALRVRFEGAAPPPAALYWRGPVFGLFTGRTWAAQNERAGGNAPEIRVDPASGIDYTVTLEPHQRDWLFALEMAPLDMPAPAAAAASGGALDLGPRMTPGAQLLAARLINERTRYSLRSYTRFTLEPGLTRMQLAESVRLPPGFNPRTLQFAADLRQQITPLGTEGRARDALLVQAVLDHFRTEKFVYTLEPALLGRNSVDEFLFDTREGFCEHYASAFAVLMRALDIPARVVTGYQGGELNPVDGFFTVRQADAHAWNEVWLDGRGWVRIDPTAAVDPARVQSSLRARAAGASGGEQAAQSASWLRRVRYNWEAMQNAWNQWVLSYSAQRQQALLERFGLAPTIEMIAILFAVALSAMLAVLAATSLRHRVVRDPLAQLTQQMRERLARAGVPAAAQDGTRALAARVNTVLDAGSAAAAAEILQTIERCRYARASSTVSRAQLRTLRTAVRRFRPRAA